jgi:hypothetical protein
LFRIRYDVIRRMKAHLQSVQRCQRTTLDTHRVHTQRIALGTFSDDTRTVRAMFRRTMLSGIMLWEWKQIELVLWKKAYKNIWRSCLITWHHSFILFSTLFILGSSIRSTISILNFSPWKSSKANENWYHVSRPQFSKIWSGIFSFFTFIIFCVWILLVNNSLDPVKKPIW